MNKIYTLCVIPKFFNTSKFLSNFSFSAHQQLNQNVSFSNQAVLNQDYKKRLSKQSAISNASLMVAIEKIEWFFYSKAAVAQSAAHYFVDF